MTRKTYPLPIRQPVQSVEGMARLATSVIDAVENLFQGRSNAVGDLTLTAGTSTTLTHPSLHADSVIVFVPTNAAAFALGAPYASTRAARTATLTHATAVGTETYAWAALG